MKRITTAQIKSATDWAERLQRLLEKKVAPLRQAYHDARHAYENACPKLKEKIAAASRDLSDLTHLAQQQQNRDDAKHWSNNVPEHADHIAQFFCNIPQYHKGLNDNADRQMHIIRAPLVKDLIGVAATNRFGDTKFYGFWTQQRKLVAILCSVPSAHPGDRNYAFGVIKRKGRWVPAWEQHQAYGIKAPLVTFIKLLIKLLINR